MASPVMSGVVPVANTAPPMGAAPQKEGFFSRLFKKKPAQPQQAYVPPASVPPYGMAQGGVAAGVGGASSGDDLTTMFSDLVDEGDDALTTVLSSEPAAFAVRSSTGERLRIASPAVLGRGSAATCRISGNTAIGRTHARITYRDGRHFIEDLASTNKTRLMGMELVPNVPAPISNGDTFELANEKFTFYVE